MLNIPNLNSGYTAIIEEFASQLEVLADEINSIGGGNEQNPGYMMQLLENTLEAL